MPEGERDGRSSSPRRGPLTLRNGSLFREIYRTGKRFRGSVIKVVYRSNALGVIRLGFSVSRRTGGAVSRNRFRRRIRSLVRQADAGTGLDMIVSPLESADAASWASMKSDFTDFLETAGGH